MSPGTSPARPSGSRWAVSFTNGSAFAACLRTGCTSFDESEAIAGLNLSTDEADAFDTADLHRGRVLATHCALLVTASLAQDKATHLLRALESNREIGVAIGVLMARHQLTRDQAFDVLRVASQRSNRKLIDIAVEVADTGLAPPGVAEGAEGL